MKKNKTFLFITLGFFLVIGLLNKPKIIEGKRMAASSKATQGQSCTNDDECYGELLCKDNKCKKGGSFICTALYKNNHVSKDDYRLMTLFGVLAVKAKKYEKDMMLLYIYDDNSIERVFIKE